MRISFEKIISLLILLLGLVLGFYIYKPLFASKLPELIEQERALPEIAAIPIRKSKLDSEFTSKTQEEILAEVSASSVYVIDIPSASILIEKNSYEPHYPASTVKLMTAITALKTYRESDSIIIEPGDIRGSNKNGFFVGEELQVRDLLKAMLISSDNDVADLLARHHPEGMTGFVQAMNDNARKLHLSSSFFANPSGIDQLAQQVTARDISVLAREIIKNPLLKNMVGIKETTISDASGEYSHNLFSTNEFLAQEFGIVGVKTGTTPLAGEVLVTEVDKAGRQVLLVVMGSDDRYSDTKLLIDWVFGEYTWKTLEEMADTL